MPSRLASSRRARPRSARAAAGFFLGASLLAVASCGSRTGLLGPGGADAQVVQPPLPDGSPADAPPDAVPCVPGRFEFELATAQLMFVVDRSGSMAFSLDGRRDPPPGVPTRWELLRDSLFQTILPFDAQLAMGAKFFPESPPPGGGANAFACRTDTGVGIPPARGNTQAILNVFDTTEPVGGTPTSEAIRLAAAYLAERRTVARSIVLATDGAPNCNEALDQDTCTCTNAPGTPSCTGDPDGQRCLDGTRTIATVQDVADNLKIPVYVIGIGSTENPRFLQVLDQMAIAGGRPRANAPFHYNVQTATEMRDALATIRDSIARCTYLTPSSPVDPDAITVEIDGRPIPRDPSRQNGWDWVDQAYGELAFFGPICDLAQAGNPSIAGVVSCEP